MSRRSVETSPTTARRAALGDGSRNAVARAKPPVSRVRERSAGEDLWEDAPPDPAATIESLRHLGYEPRSAIADLVDNSLAWGAPNVTVRAHWNGGASWCAVIDDGSGMSENRLARAMRIGSSDPVDARVEGDLGRYGFGLKTASFSQAREVTVFTRNRRGAPGAVRCWDLDEVRRRGRWSLRRAAPAGADELLKSLDTGQRGTIVLWRRLTDLVDPEDVTDDTEAQRRFNHELETIACWLGMVFGRFLAGGVDAPLRMTLNGSPVRPFDPFLANHAATQSLPEDRIVFRDAEVTVRPYVLPHESKLTASQVASAAGPLGWSEQQGFYVYRRNRLIVAGDWLQLVSRDNAYNLARIAVDVPAELDDGWQLDIRKAAIRPPSALRNDLSRIAKETRRRAKAVLKHRGTVVRRGRDPKLEHVWVLKARHGVKEPRINRSHALVAKTLAEAGERRTELSAVLSLIEESLPMALLPSKPVERPPLEDNPPEDLFALAESAYESLLRQGRSRKEAAQRIRNTEPFNHYPEILERFGGCLG